MNTEVYMTYEETDKGSNRYPCTVIKSFSCYTNRVEH